MTVTRFRFRLAEMILMPTMLILIDGLSHLAEGKPLMTDFLVGGVAAAVLIRGIDAMRAAQHCWPETDRRQRP